MTTVLVVIRGHPRHGGDMRNGRTRAVEEIRPRARSDIRDDEGDAMPGRASEMRLKIRASSSLDSLSVGDMGLCTPS